jgi:hypothetical protein
LQISADNNEEIMASPAPASLILAVIGVPVACLGLWLRRRKPAVVPG